MKTESKKTGVAGELETAMRSFDQGRLEDARKICDRILAKDPENVVALNILGGCLARSNQLGAAIQVAEKVCFLSPGHAFYLSNLSYLYSLKGDFQKAILVMAQAVKSDPENTVYQTKFARLTDNLEFYKATRETDVIKDAISLCLGNPAIDAGLFSTAWHSLVLLEPLFVQLAMLTQLRDFEAQAEQLDAEALTGPLSETFLLLGLKSLLANSEKFERIVMFLRSYFLMRLGDYDAAAFLPFLCALAEHCSLNEYVYSFTDEERSTFGALAEDLDLPADADADAMARFALVACYMNPMQIEGASRIAKAGSSVQNDAFAQLIKRTVTMPRKTREYSETIASLSPIDDPGEHSVSASVARQYEENPYPRWRHLEVPALTEQQKEQGRGRAILVAGCGTGYEPLNLAVRYPGASIVGVDLSVPSLAYGKQKADEFGVDNIEFVQADILDLEKLGQQFDLITCVGVLHHMQDPVEGWRKLLTCLKPDGFMKIALYSENARQTVVSCRNWIDEQGFESTPEGIRRFRQAVMDLAPENPLRDIMKWTDFYSLSMCRDLVFHVQEHRVTLPWIKSALDELGLVCLSARISNPLFRKEYLSMYPDDPAVKNLDHLHGYENHNPATFRDMYQFWCCRKGSVTALRPPEWF